MEAKENCYPSSEGEDSSIATYFKLQIWHIWLENYVTSVVRDQNGQQFNTLKKPWSGVLTTDRVLFYSVK